MFRYEGEAFYKLIVNPRAVHQFWDFLYKVPPDPTIQKAVELHANYPVTDLAGGEGEGGGDEEPDPEV